jgi:Ca2+-binding EF-hand superfamily protein
VRAQAAAERAKPTQGAALAAQVERKLHASFQAADSAGTGRITREQARAAGLGTVAEHFDRIDAQHTGTVSFDEVRRYLKSQGARNL